MALLTSFHYCLKGKTLNVQAANIRQIYSLSDHVLLQRFFHYTLY